MSAWTNGYRWSRQITWLDGERMVEVVHGLDDVDCDALEISDPYDDPRECVADALVVARAWQDREQSIEVLVYAGSTLGASIGVEGEPINDDTAAKVTAWGQREYDALPKCARCGAPIYGDGYCLVDSPDDERYCREYCAERVYAALVGADDGECGA